MRDQYDVVIIGGGMIGLSLATALSQADITVAVIESKAPQLHWKESDYDARVSAIHLGTHRFFDSLRLWSSMRSSSYSPLEHMVVWDVVGGGEICFDAADIAEEALGYIVENREIVRVFWEFCEASSYVDVLSSSKASAINGNVLVLEEGRELAADLIVGADGAHSWLRQQMKVECFEKPYHHEALVAVIKTEKPHLYTAYQPFLAQGPLGVLPLSDAHQVAIVWSVDPARCEQLMTMSIENFNRELMNALSSKLGTMHCLSARKKIALTQRHAEHYVQAHRALIGDAAHTIHPLAGQGANLGFMDVASLAKILATAKKNDQSMGSYKILRQYERQRKSENERMLLMMSGFKSVFSSQSPLTVSARSWGFNLVNKTSLLKKYFIHAAVHPDP